MSDPAAGWLTLIGVAGLWRLMDKIEEIRRRMIVIAVAGMDAALASVVGGLTSGVVIAVPTSVGYGAAEGGRTALNAMLASCAPGIVVCNVDNGYGAACSALRIHGRQHGRMRYCERPPSLAWSKTLACVEALCAGTGRSRVWPVGERRQVRIGKTRS